MPTWDDRNNAALAKLHPVFAERVKKLLHAMVIMQIPVLIAQGLRTYEEQQALYDMGRTKPSTATCNHEGIHRPVGTCTDHPFGATVTRAKPGYSWHQFALSVDLYPDNVEVNGLQPEWDANATEWRTLLRVGKGFALAEGAEWRTFPDNPHFYPKELVPTPPDSVRALYAAQGLQGVWTSVNTLVKPDA